MPDRRPSIWKPAVAVFFIGLVLTTAFVLQQRRSEARLAAEEFERTRAELAAEFSAAISQRVGEFDIILDFVNSQSSLNSQELWTFLNERSEGRPELADGNPGLVIAEIVTDVAQLEARERAAGRPDFRVVNALPSSSTERVVITHVETNVPALGLSLEGFDVTSFRSLMSPPPDAGENRVFAQVSSVERLFGGFRLLGGNGTADEAGLGEAVIYLIARYVSAEGDRTGYISKVETVSDVAAEIADQVPAGFRLEISLGDEGIIGVIDNRSSDVDAFSGTLDVVGSTSTQVVDLAPLALQLSATDQIATPDPRLGESELWMTGLAISLGTALLAARRALQLRRLADTTLELKLAQTLATTDPLTGLLNRQGLVDAVEGERPLAGTLLFVDLDNFKTVNDNSGHAEGDRVLRELGRRLRAAVRNDDFVCRIGGDEFLIFLRAPADESRIAALRHMITSAVEETDSRISCSIGVATRETGTGRSLDVLFRVADSAMYGNKRSKRSDGPSSPADPFRR